MSKRHQSQPSRQNTRKESSNDVRIYLGDPSETTRERREKKRENEDLHAIVVLEITWQLRNLRKLRIDT